MAKGIGTGVGGRWIVLMNAEVTFLLPVASQPRYHRRIQMLANAGMSVRVAAVERDYIQGSDLGHPIHSLGKVEHGRYAKRLLSAPRTLAAIRRLGATDIVYAFEAELGLYAHLARIGSRVVVEVGDIREILTRGGVVPAMIRRMDRLVMARADRVVATTQAFLTAYYSDRLGLDMGHGLIIENKIDRRSLPVLERATVPPVLADPDMVRIGWFGLLRCRDTWHALRAWASREPHRRLVSVRGYPTADGPSPEELRAAPGVVFGGEYRWPSDLPEMYGAVDVVCAAAPTHGGEGNWLWPRANRFYEAGFFRRPMIVLTGSADGREVVGRNLGREINFFEHREAVTQLECIRPDAIKRWSESYASVPRSVFIETDEGDQLARELTRVARSVERRVPPDAKNKLAIQAQERLMRE